MKNSVKMSELSRGTNGVFSALVPPSKRHPAPHVPSICPARALTVAPCPTTVPPYIYRGHGGGRVQKAHQMTPTNHRIGRQPTPQICHRCKAPTLTAWDHDRCAIQVHLEPHALTPHGEIWALQNGRHTYEQQPTGIRPRNQWNIPGRPPTTTLPVFPTHTCGHPVPEQHRLRIPKKPTTTPVQHDGHFPF